MDKNQKYVYQIFDAEGEIVEYCVYELLETANEIKNNLKEKYNEFYQVRALKVKS